MFSLKAKKYLIGARLVPADFRNSKRYRKSIPSAGVALDDTDATILK